MTVVALLLACRTADTPQSKDEPSTSPWTVTTSTSPTTTTPACTPVPWYADADGDRAGDPADVIFACADPGGRVATGDDCDDADPTVFPGAAEACDGVDSDCGLDDDVDLVTVVGGATFATLADALAVAVDGDVVAICPGIYPTAVDVRASVTLEGEGAREDVVLQGTPGLPVVAVSAGDVTLAHLTLTSGGDALADGGGVSAAAARSLTVEDCVLSDNVGRDGGGLRGPDDGALVLDASVVEGNTASVGGGVYALGGAVTGCEITLNTAESAGGVVGYPGPTGLLDLTGTVIHDNVATAYGGGLGLLGAFAVTGGDVRANVAAYGGGGVYGPDFAGTVTGALVTGNVAQGALGLGGGVFADTDARFTFVGCTFDGNTSGGWGGGIYAVDGPLVLDGGAVVASVAVTGGGVFLDGAATLDATGVDLGTGALDNVPDDVGVAAAGAGFAGYGAGTTVHCDAAGCTP